jgi:hypothetical protein
VDYVDKSMIKVGNSHLIFLFTYKFQKGIFDVTDQLKKMRSLIPRNRNETFVIKSQILSTRPGWYWTRHLFLRTQQFYKECTNGRSCRS